MEDQQTRMYEIKFKSDLPLEDMYQIIYDTLDKYGINEFSIFEIDDDGSLGKDIDNSEYVGKANVLSSPDGLTLDEVEERVKEYKGVDIDEV